MYVLEEATVTMTTALNPPLHWYLRDPTTGVVSALSDDLKVYGNQAIINKVTPRNSGTI